jgi:hypothetical protein
MLKVKHIWSQEYPHYGSGSLWIDEDNDIWLRTTNFVTSYVRLRDGDAHSRPNENIPDDMKRFYGTVTLTTEA